MKGRTLINQQFFKKKNPNWRVVCFAVFSQPIVSRAKPEMLKSHFIPTMEKLKKRTAKVVAEEEHLRMEGKTEGDEEEGTIRDEFAVLCRDLYALYPLLIRYIDNNRSSKQKNYSLLNY